MLTPSTYRSWFLPNSLLRNTILSLYNGVLPRLFCRVYVSLFSFFFLRELWTVLILPKLWMRSRCTYARLLAVEQQSCYRGFFRFAFDSLLLAFEYLVNCAWMMDKKQNKKLPHVTVSTIHILMRHAWTIAKDDIVSVKVWRAEAV